MNICFMGVAGEAGGICHVTDLPIRLFMDGISTVRAVFAERLGCQNNFSDKSKDCKNHEAQNNTLDVGIVI